MDVTGEGGTGSAVVSVDIALVDRDGVGGLRAQVGVLYGSCWSMSALTLVYSCEYK